MAIVEKYDFDPSQLAHKFLVSETTVPVDDRLIGTEITFRDPKALLWETDFSYYAPWHSKSNWQGYQTGRMVKGGRTFYWVQHKLSDLNDHEDALVQRYLRDQGYKEPRQRYSLTMKTWEKLLELSFDETQAGDYELANAADDVCPSGDLCWDSIPGVYALTRKGRIKFIVSRNDERL